MVNWQWLAIGAVAGYLLCRHGSGVGGGFTISANVGAAGPGRGPRVAGSGATPLDQPTGSEHYNTVGAYEPLYGSGFPDLVDAANQRIVNGGPVT